MNKETDRQTDRLSFPQIGKKRKNGLCYFTIDDRLRDFAALRKISSTKMDSKRDYPCLFHMRGQGQVARRVQTGNA